ESRDGVRISGHSSVTLVASGNSPYDDIVLFQRRDSSAPIRISGGDVNINGTVYAPHAKLSFTGSHNLNVRSANYTYTGTWGEMIVRRLSHRGPGTIIVDSRPAVNLIATVNDGATTTVSGSTQVYTVRVTNSSEFDVHGASLTDVLSGEGIVSSY